MKTYLGLSAAACFLLAVTSASAGSALGSTAARAALDFRIKIPAVVKAEARIDPVSLRLTVEDLRRGYVDLDGASSVVLTSNARTGFMLAVAFDANTVDAVELRMVGRAVRILASGDAVVMQSGALVSKAVVVSYRLYLAARAQAGEHRWPLAISYAPAGI
jgi:hypothetical protein